MAKKATNGAPTKGQLIRDMYAQGITSGKEIAAKLEEAGQKTSLPMVYTTISQMKKENGSQTAKRGGNKPAVERSSGEAAPKATTGATKQSTSGGSVSLADLAAISELAKRVGGVEQLQRVLASLAGLG